MQGYIQFQAAWLTLTAAQTLNFTAKLMSWGWKKKNLHKPWKCVSRVNKHRLNAPANDGAGLKSQLTIIYCNPWLPDSYNKSSILHKKKNTQKQIKNALHTTQTHSVEYTSIRLNVLNATPCRTSLWDDNTQAGLSSQQALFIPGHVVLIG